MGREQRVIPCLVWEWLAGTRKLGIMGRDKREQEQREVPGPVWIDWTGPKNWNKMDKQSL